MTPIKNPLVHRYWIEFEPVGQGATAEPWLSIKRRGISMTSPRAFGVTAYTLDDALHVLRTELFDETELPAIRSVVEDVDDSQLGSLARLAGLPEWLPQTDFNPVSWVSRGIWFPSLGQSASSR